MPLILIGAMMIVAGIVLSALSTIKRGRMSEPPEAVPGGHGDTLEPSGRGQRLSLKAELPGIALILLGVILMFAGQ